MCLHKCTLICSAVDRNRSHRPRAAKKYRKQEYLFTPCFSLSVSLFFSLSLSLQGPEKKNNNVRRRSCSTFEASLSGLAAWSCVSKPRRAFHPLCCPRCVQCTGALCGEGDDTSHSVFCPELRGGGVGAGGVEQRGDKKQTYRRLRLFKAAMHKGS